MKEHRAVVCAMALLLMLNSVTGCLMFRTRPDAKTAAVTERVQQLNYEGIDAYTAGDLDKAVKIWKKALSLDPSNNEVLRNVKKARAEMQALTQRGG